VIGAGPAGLTAAVDLIRLGYPVTVFEEKNDPGGMLRYGIPPYRLPDRILKREIDWIKGLGVRIRNKEKIEDPAKLLDKDYSAVLIAGGAPKSFPLGIEGENADGVIDALVFLKELNTGKLKKIKGNTVVIGGGSTAFDAARSSIRLGAEKVVLAYRRGIEEMPADLQEIKEAQEEKIEIITLAIPKRIIVKHRKVVGIEFLKAKLGKLDVSGRRQPVPISNSEFIVDADLIITAVGAMPDVGSVGGVKVTTSRGVVEVAEDSKTVVEGIFAAGDVEMGPASVVDAIGRGHNAARGIHEYLSGISKTEEIVNSLQIYLGSPISSKNVYKTKKKIKPVRPSSFEEVEGAFNDFEAVEEASRCFSCGPCYACPVCLPNCDNKQLIAEIENITLLIKAPPKLSKEITENGPIVLKLKAKGKTKSIKLFSLTSFVDQSICIGCGRCEEVCAYRAIKNVFSKNKRIVSQVDHNSCASCSACVSECPSGAITQGYMSDDAILKRLTKVTTPVDGVKALMSYWSIPSPVLGAYDGVVELMSARKASPSFLIKALSITKRGLILVKPDKATGSHYLPWEEHPDDVVHRTLILLKSMGISPDRIHYRDLPKGTTPVKLLEAFSEELDKKRLNKLSIPSIESIKSPLGESIALLRIMAVNNDIKPIDEFNNLPSVKSSNVAFFEGCLPLLNNIGIAHNFYDLSSTRNAIYRLIEKLKLDFGNIQGFSCPSKGLSSTKTPGLVEIVKKIESKNIKAYKRAKPKSIVVGTPEAFSSLSKEKQFGKIISLPEVLLNKIKTRDLKQVNLRIGIHHACKMEKDPFIEPVRKILKKIPGVKIIELKGICGQSAFENLNGESKQKAVNLMKEASEKNADVILCTSPYCEAHLKLCHREGSWRNVDIELTDIYNALHSSLIGEL